MAHPVRLAHSTTGTNPIAVLTAGSNVVNTVTFGAVLGRASDCRVSISGGLLAHWLVDVDFGSILPL